MILRNLPKYKFNKINVHINSEEFPYEPIRIKSQDQYQLFSFKEPVDYGEALEAITKEGYEPANIYELSCWKGWNKTSYVAALGSHINLDGVWHVPCFSMDWEVSGHRVEKKVLGFCLFGTDKKWNAGSLFLAIKI
jgi:hypothetical protein